MKKHLAALLLVMTGAAHAQTPNPDKVRFAGEIFFVFQVCNIADHQELQIFKNDQLAQGMSSDEFDDLLQDGSQKANQQWYAQSAEHREKMCDHVKANNGLENNLNVYFNK